MALMALMRNAVLIGLIVETTGCYSSTGSTIGGSFLSESPQSTGTVTLAKISNFYTIGMSINWTMNVAATVGGSSTLTCSSALSGTSSNSLVLANNQINFSGTYPNCVITLGISGNTAGSTTLTLTAIGNSATASQTFTLSIISPTTATYSVRRVVAGYTGNAMNVRRSSDNSTIDIGFTNSGDLDTATLLAFIGSNTGYLTTWYDQSGNGNSASQASVLAQPIIVNAGTLMVSGSVLKPTVAFPSISSALAYSGSIQSVQTINAVRDLNTTNGVSTLFAMPAHTDFSVRMGGSYNGTFPTFYTGNPPNSNDWMFGTGSPPTAWVNGVQTLTVTSPALHRLTTIASSTQTATSWSISSTFLNRGLNNNSGVSELNLFANSISTQDMQALETLQQSYFF